jgi:8-oxo-dGTP pyrophosphatase MutT (NUDIX family)
VLVAAGTRARRAAAAPRMRELLAGVSWPALLDELARQRLVPLLGGRILEAAPGAPEPFARAVAEETRAARAAGELGELITLRIAAALEAAGIANVPLKGPLLARALHGDTAMRSSRDIDLLVARADLGPSVDTLAPLGWHVDAGAAAPVLHVRLVSDAGLPDVEIHWRVHWYECAFAARALARAIPGPDGVRRLRPEDELVALVLYHARDGFAGLRHATDLTAWWDSDRDPALAQPLLGATIAAHPSLERALTASAIVLDADASHVLLTLHRKGGFWAQMGGHCEPGDATLADAALREAREESGIDDLRLVRDEPVDLDRHALSTAFGTCGEHLDVRYAVVAPAGARHVVSEESSDVAWFPYDALPDGCVDISALITRARRTIVPPNS